MSDPQQQEWRPIETAPKDGTMVMLYGASSRWRRDKGAISIGYWHQPANPKASGLWVCAFGATRTQPTYWMPLPDPPRS